MNSSILVAPALIGIVGPGQMGLPVARSLARAGYRIPAHDLSGVAVRLDVRVPRGSESVDAV